MISLLSKTFVRESPRCLPQEGWRSAHARDEDGARGRPGDLPMRTFLRTYVLPAKFHVVSIPQFRGLRLAIRAYVLLIKVRKQVRPVLPLSLRRRDGRRGAHAGGHPSCYALRRTSGLLAAHPITSQWPKSLLSGDSPFCIFVNISGYMNAFIVCHLSLAWRRLWP